MVAEPTGKKKVSSFTVLQWQKQNQAEDSSDQSHGSGRAIALTVLEGRVVELAEGMGQMQELCNRAIKCSAQGRLGAYSPLAYRDRDCCTFSDYTSKLETQFDGVCG